MPLKARSGRWVPQPVLAQRLAFFRFDLIFGIVKGEQPFTRCGESGVQRSGGGLRNTPPYLWPARSASHLTKRKNLPRATSARTSSKKKPALRSGPRGAQSHLTEKENQPRATSARTSLKKKPALPLARAERKPLDRRKKHPPRHRRAIPLKENSNPAHAHPKTRTLS